MHDPASVPADAPKLLLIGPAAGDAQLLGQLAQARCHVVAARSGREALRTILCGDPPDMVLIDPAEGVDAQAIAQCLRNNPPTAATPVALLRDPGTGEGRAPAAGMPDPARVAHYVAERLRAARHERHVQALGERMARHLAPQAWDRLFRGPDRETMSFDERLLTVLYTDTALLPGFGHRGHDAFVAQVDWLAARHGGHVDGFVFGAVVAFFDDPRNCIRMALDLQRVARELRLRIGVQTAAAAIATFRTGGVTRSALLGPATAQAACLAGAAAVGSIAVSRDTYGQVREELPRDTGGCLVTEEFDGSDIAQACITPAPSEMSSFAGLGLT